MFRALAWGSVAKQKYLCAHEAHILAGETQMINGKDNTSVNYDTEGEKEEQGQQSPGRVALYRGWSGRPPWEGDI